MSNKKALLWLEERDVLAIHDRLIAAHGGAPRLRDRGLLQSALARPRQHPADDNRADIVAMAALYTGGIVRNHPFVDGIKRTGFVVGILFLELRLRLQSQRGRRYSGGLGPCGRHAQRSWIYRMAAGERPAQPAGAVRRTFPPV